MDRAARRPIGLYDGLPMQGMLHALKCSARLIRIKRKHTEACEHESATSMSRVTPAMGGQPTGHLGAVRRRPVPIRPVAMCQARIWQPSRIHKVAPRLTERQRQSDTSSPKRAALPQRRKRAGLSEGGAHPRVVGGAHPRRCPFARKKPPCHSPAATCSVDPLTGAAP